MILNQSQYGFVETVEFIWKSFFYSKIAIILSNSKSLPRKVIVRRRKKNRKQIKFFIRNLFRAVCALCISASHVRCHPISDFIISFSFLAILPPSFVLYLLFLSCLCTLITLCFPFFSLSLFFFFVSVRCVYPYGFVCVLQLLVVDMEEILCAARVALTYHTHWKAVRRKVSTK